MTTNTNKRGRFAGLLALSLMLAAAALPAQASGLSITLGTGGHDSPPVAIGDGSGMSSGMGDHDNCFTRQEVKNVARTQYSLKNIDVSRTADRDIYKVSGYGKKQVAERLLQASSGVSDNKLIRYVLLFDACTDHIVRVLQPVIN